MTYVEVDIMISFSTVHCGDRFLASRKGRTGGGEFRDGMLCAWWLW